MLGIISSRKRSLFKNHVCVICYPFTIAVIDDRLLVIPKQAEMILNRSEFKTFFRQNIFCHLYILHRYVGYSDRLDTSILQQRYGILQIFFKINRFMYPKKICRTKTEPRHTFLKGLLKITCSKLLVREIFC